MPQAELILSRASRLLVHSSGKVTDPIYLSISRKGRCVPEKMLVSQGAGGEPLKSICFVRPSQLMI